MVSRWRVFLALERASHLGDEHVWLDYSGAAQFRLFALAEPFCTQQLLLARRRVVPRCLPIAASMRTTTLLARHSTLQQRLIARAHRRLASDAYRVANAFAFGVAATISTAWALEGDVLVLGSSGHMLSRLLNKLGIITLPPNWCSAERQPSEQERFAGHADVVAEATAADGARVRVLCVWTEDTSGSYSEPPTPSRGTTSTRGCRCSTATAST